MNAQNNAGGTALTLVAHWKHEKALNMLLNHPQIKVNLQDKGGSTALIATVLSRFTKGFNILLAHPKIDVILSDEFGHTALSYAYKNDSIKMSNALREKKTKQEGKVTETLRETLERTRMLSRVLAL